MSSTKSFVLRLAAAGALACTTLAPTLAPIAAHAADAEPAAQQIDSFDSALLRTMKTSGGVEARSKVIAPAVDTTFDIPTMVGFAVGPTWTTTSADDKAALIASFRKFTVASYAKNFSAFSGQKITVDPNVLTRLPDKLVKTTLSDGSNSVVLGYRMRQSGATWKVIDVLYNGSISQLTTQRSDFSGTLASGGVKALIAKLDAQTQKLLAG